MRRICLLALLSLASLANAQPTPPANALIDYEGFARSVAEVPSSETLARAIPSKATRVLIYGYRNVYELGPRSISARRGLLSRETKLDPRLRGDDVFAGDDA